MEEELFKIDIDGEENEETKTPDYKVDLYVVNKSLNDSDVAENCGNSSPVTSGEKCWNCNNVGHALRDCPVPHNRAKIARAKKSFMKQVSNSKRYHDNKFAKFRPGHLSSKLRKALRLRDNEAPMHIYMMRVLGYPPGWLAEAKISNSGIKMYNDRGKRIPEPGEEDGEILNKVMKYNIEQLIEYPGFNVPLDRKVYDNHRSLGFPPMKSEHKMENFIKTLQELSNKEEEMSADSTDDEPIDMEISEMLPAQIFEQVRNIKRRIKEIDGQLSRDDLGIVKTTLSEQDSRKRTIKDSEESDTKRQKSTDSNDDSEFEEGEIINVNALNDYNTEENKSDDNKEEEVPEEGEITSETTEDGNSAIKRSLPINIVNSLKEDSLPSTPSPRGSITSTSFGTPNIKNHSPYSKLPSFDNFNKDISDVIGFENLPDSVGKYSSMCSVITKIRSFMTSKTNKSEGSPKDK